MSNFLIEVLVSYLTSSPKKTGKRAKTKTKYKGKACIKVDFF
jgi:hypothetical protein